MKGLVSENKVESNGRRPPNVDHALGVCTHTDTHTLAYARTHMHTSQAQVVRSMVRSKVPFLACGQPTWRKGWLQERLNIQG